MDSFAIWMLCIVGMMLLYGIFAVWFSVTGEKDIDKKGSRPDDSPAEAKKKSAAK